MPPQAVPLPAHKGVEVLSFDLYAVSAHKPTTECTSLTYSIGGRCAEKLAGVLEKKGEVIQTWPNISGNLEWMVLSCKEPITVFSSGHRFLFIGLTSRG